MTTYKDQCRSNLAQPLIIPLVRHTAPVHKIVPQRAQVLLARGRDIVGDLRFGAERDGERRVAHARHFVVVRAGTCWVLVARFVDTALLWDGWPRRGTSKGDDTTLGVLL